MDIKLRKAGHEIFIPDGAPLPGLVVDARLDQDGRAGRRAVDRPMHAAVAIAGAARMRRIHAGASCMWVMPPAGPSCRGWWRP